MHDLIVVKNRIVTTGFPELSGVDISLDYKKIGDAYFEFDRIGKGSYHIDVDKKLRESPLAVLEGGMAHDLAHIARDYKRSWFTHGIDVFLYSNWSWYETRDERHTDILVVTREYGPKLLEFLRYANQRREDFTAEDGLTVEELEQMLASGDNENCI